MTGCRFATHDADHVCVDNEGHPILAGQSKVCWYEARTDLLGQDR